MLHIQVQLTASFVVADCSLISLQLTRLRSLNALIPRFSGTRFVILGERANRLRPSQTTTRCREWLARANAVAEEATRLLVFPPFVLLPLLS